MEERLSAKLDEYLDTAQGRVVDLRSMRVYFNIEPGSKDDNNLRSLMRFRVKKKIAVPSGLEDGRYKVVTKVHPVRVFKPDRQKRPPFKLYFPRDFDTEMEFLFAEDIVIREGDLITIGGMSNFGKTCLALNFCGENIDYKPVLMGNEYTTKTDDGYEATPRFIDRLENMDWVKWVDDDGMDKFTLLPIREDYAEHVVRDRINIFDWINLDAGRSYDIGKVMEDIKFEVGRGIGIAVLQKGEGTTMARGGQFTKDFTDCELLIDKLSDYESLLTIGKVKEYNKYVMGRTFAFGIKKGVQIINFREVVKCPKCFGKGWVKWGNSNKPCEECNKLKYVDK